jgi:predicted enzyme related to lactoylglutathione lyase
MSETTSTAPGTFCWIEAATADPICNRNFYTALFGWNTSERKTSDESPYFTAELGGKLIGGLGAQHEQARKRGAPPRWLSYVAVADVEASSKKAAALGATVLLPPHPMGLGSLSLLRDPTGAVLALWQSMRSMGPFLRGQPGALGWNELSTSDLDRAASFYSALFDWRPQVQRRGELVYTTFHLGDQPVGGMMPRPKELAGTPSEWNVYFAVADAEATVAKATMLQAKTLAPLHEVPGVGRFAFLRDPQGAAFAVITFAPS